LFCCDGDCCYCCNYCFEVVPEIVIEEKTDVEEVIELNKVYENHDIFPKGDSVIEMTDIVYI